MPKAIEIIGVITDDNDGHVYERFGFNSIYPAKIKAAVEAANCSDIEVNINSPGGNIYAAQEIYSLLRSYKGNVTIHVTGLAASAASVIMCARYCDISPVGLVMVHCSSASLYGNKSDMQKGAEILSSIDETIAAAYIEKTGMPKAEALNLMECESWITAEKAVEIGLCDKITPPVENRDRQSSETEGKSGSLQLTANNMQDKAAAQKAKAIFNYLKLKGENHNGN